MHAIATEYTLCVLLIVSGGGSKVEFVEDIIRMVRMPMCSLVLVYVGDSEFALSTFMETEKDGGSLRTWRSCLNRKGLGTLPPFLGLRL
jgi:hypothetical protein